MIRISDFTFQYDSGRTPALQNINMTIADGDFVGIIGNSGAGKSTLTYAMNGVIPGFYRGDYYGSVEVNGMDTVETRPEIIASHVGSVFQDIDAQMVASVVEDEILFGLENFGIPHDEIEGRVTEALAACGIEDLRMRHIDTLSGGQRQKVAVASIVALRPRMIVLDEPTGELDPQSSEQIFALLSDINRVYGTTIVIVEQKIALLCAYARKLAVLDHGHLAFFGPVREVLANGRAMESLGIHVPRIVSLHQALSERGWYQGTAPVNMDEAERMAREAMQ